MRLFRFSACVPPQWSTTAADYLHQLEEGNAVSFYKAVMDPLIWNALLHILRNSGLGHAWDKSSDCSCMSRAEIETVYRIENTRLWHRYKARLAAMRQDHAASKVSVVSADLDLDGCGNFLGGYQWTLDCGKALAMDLRVKKNCCTVRLGPTHIPLSERGLTTEPASVLSMVLVFTSHVQLARVINTLATSTKNAVSAITPER